MDWFRLWHDMPNDPKWRTIARVSQQRIGDVIAVYLHVLVDASSNAAERGRTQSVCIEDVASALDLKDEQVTSILDAMQGRVLDGDCVTGWSKRQPAREDGSAARAKAWRERQKSEREHDRTQVNAKERPDTDTDTDTDTELKKEDAIASSAPSRKVALDAGGNWTGISTAQWSTWSTAYPALSLDAELAKAAAWIIANPKNKKSNYARFLTNWLSRAQDRAPVAVGTGASQHQQSRADRRSEWNEELTRVLAEDARSTEKFMGVIDVSGI